MIILRQTAFVIWNSLLHERSIRGSIGSQCIYLDFCMYLYKNTWSYHTWPHSEVVDFQMYFFSGFRANMHVSKYGMLFIELSRLHIVPKLVRTITRIYASIIRKDSLVTYTKVCKQWSFFYYVLKLFIDYEYDATLRFRSRDKILPINRVWKTHNRAWYN